MIATRTRIRGISIRPEHELLLLASRKRISTQHRKRIRELLGSDLDWGAFLADVDEQNTFPLVCWNLGSFPGEIPAKDAEVLRKYFEGNARRALFLTRELVDVLDRFGSAGIPTIPYKGPALAEMAYGHVGLRSFTDVDLLLRQRDIPKAAEEMQALGFRPDFDPAALRSKNSPGQYSFERGAGISRVELHTEHTLRYYPVLPDFGRLRERLIKLPLAGRQIETFCAEDLLPFLCVHGSKHFWERLQWICDVVELVELPQGFNWESSLESAGQMRVEGMVLLGLQLASDLFEARIPDEVLEKARRDSSVQSLASQVCKRLLVSNASNSGLASRFLFRWRIPERFSEKILYMVRLATSPTEADREYISLPPSLSALYRIVRPIRLAREYGLGFFGKRPPSDLGIYVSTPDPVVETMLRIAGLSPDDFLFDLGCGDGRIVIAAAKTYGVRAIGVEANPHRCALAKANAQRAGVGAETRFVRGDARSIDLRKATVVTLYLSLAGNLKLRKKLDEELPPGARIVSRDFEIPGWSAERVEPYEQPGELKGKLYLYLKSTQPAAPAFSDIISHRSATVGSA